jgi:arabinan endo-1,5-alpha-L-arabinosidase
MKHLLFRAVLSCVCLLVAVCSAKGEEVQKTLVSAGEFKKIYDTGPSWYINDHCFVRGRDGLWHMFGITGREPADPINEIHFAHATAETLLQFPWEKQAYALTAARTAPWNEVHLWAPHVIHHQGMYYMFYCAGDTDHRKYKIHMAVSPDMKTWTRSPMNPVVVDGYDARDPFVFRVNDRWVMVYTATSEPEGGNHIVACVISDDLMTWGNRCVVFTDPSQGTHGGPTESPFVVNRGDLYYLFIGPRGSYDGTDVFVSRDPFHWDITHKAGHIPAHAAEIIQDVDGRWYVSRCGWERGGLYLALLSWHDGREPSPLNPEDSDQDTTADPVSAGDVSTRASQEN